MQIAAEDLVCALKNFFKEAITHLFVDEDHILDEVLEHVIFVLLAVSKIIHKESFGVLKRGTAHLGLSLRFFILSRAVKSLLRIEHLCEEYINEDLYLIQREKFTHQEVNQLKANFSLPVLLYVTMLTHPSVRPLSLVFTFFVCRPFK